MSADPADIPAKRALLAARADAVELYADSTTATDRRYVPHPLQAVFAPRSSDVVLVAWAATYKGATYGDSFACDAALQGQALAALLDHALQVLDLVDLRRGAWGLSSPVFVG